MFPASLVIVAACTPPDERAPVGELDTGADARLDSSITWTYAPGPTQGHPWPAAADVNKDGRRDLVFGLANGPGKLNTFRNTGSSPWLPPTPTASVAVNEM